MSPHAFTRAAQALLLGSLLLIAISAWQQRLPLLNIDTNLKSLSPEFLASPALQHAADAVARSIEQRFSVVLAAEERDSLEAAVEDFEEAIDEHAELFNRQQDVLGDVIEGLTPYRFLLLSNAQAQHLREKSDADLLLEAQQTLHGLSGGVGALPFTQDPFGLFNDYLLTLSGIVKSDDAMVQRDENGRPRHYYPLHFQLSGDALKLERQAAIVSTLSEIEQTINQRQPGVHFYHSGVLFFAHDASEKSQRDISRISTFSSIGVALLIVLAFYSLRPLLLPLLSVLIGVGAAYVCTLLLFGDIHIITLIFGASLIGVVIDYALHFSYHHQHHAEAHPDILHKALLFSLLTSCVGYGALALSDLEALQRVAIFSVLGLCFAWLSVISLGPWLVAAQRRRGTTLFETGVCALQRGIAALPSKLVMLAAISALTSCALWLLLGLRVNDNPRIFFTPDADLLMQAQTVSDVSGGVEPGRYFVVRGDSVATVYEQLDMLYAKSTQDALFGVRDLLPSPQAQQQHWQLNARLYGEQGLAYPWLERLGAAPASLEQLRHAFAASAHRTLTPDIFFNELATFLPPLWSEHGGEYASVVLVRQGSDMTALAKIADQDTIVFVDTATLMGEAIAKQRRASTEVLGLALLLTLALCCLRYRRAKAALLVGVPTVALATSIVVLQILAIPLSLFHIMAMFLVLGLGMDYVIFVHDMPEHARQTLPAVLLSALTSLLSFGLLALSQIPVVSAFGVTVLIGNSVNLLGAFYLFTLKQRRTSP